MTQAPEDTNEMPRRISPRLTRFGGQQKPLDRVRRLLEAGSAGRRPTRDDGAWLAACIDEAAARDVSIDEAMGLGRHWRRQFSRDSLSRLRALRLHDDAETTAARRLLSAVRGYLPTYRRLRRAGQLPTGPEAHAYHAILNETGGKVPSLSTLRRRVDDERARANNGVVLARDNRHDPDHEQEND